VEPSEYKRNFVEIIDGCSTAFIKHKRVFIQHKKIADVVDYDLIYQNFLDYAKGRGMPSEEDILQEQIEGGFWDPEDDSKIEEREAFVENLKLTKSEMIIEEVRKNIQNQIDDALSEINFLKNKKENLISSCAERYATNRANDYYIVRSFFKDVKQKDYLYTEEQFEYLEHEELTDLISAYNKFNERFSDISIQKLALQDFLKTYYSFSETSTDFYGKPAVDLTNFQLHLLIYVKIFKNIFESNKDIPERMHKDPQALMDFAEGKRTRERVQSKIKNNSNAISTVVGATKEDYKDMGVEPAQTTNQKTMHDAAKAKGGRLSMKDLMALNGL